MPGREEAIRLFLSLRKNTCKCPFALQSCRGNKVSPMHDKQDRISMAICPLRLVYSDKARLPIGDHIFHGGKYRGIRERLLRLGAFTESEFLPSPRCQETDALLVHTQLWVDKVKRGKLSTREELELEVPYSQELVEAFWYMTGGSIVAAEQALRNQCCVHIGG